MTIRGRDLKVGDVVQLVNLNSGEGENLLVCGVIAKSNPWGVVNKIDCGGFPLIKYQNSEWWHSPVAEFILQSDKNHVKRKKPRGIRRQLTYIKNNNKSYYNHLKIITFDEIRFIDKKDIDIDLIINLSKVRKRIINSIDEFFSSY